MQTITKKRRWLALLLTLYSGTGHLYLGQIKKAFFFAFTPMLLAIIGLELEVYLPYSLLVLALIGLFLLLYAFVDIWKSFPLESHENPLYSRWYFVVLFIFFTALVSYGLEHLTTQYSSTKTFTIPSHAMENTVYKGDYIIGHRTKEVKRGNVVIFNYPLRPDIFYIKRLVAVGGDELVYQDKHLYVHFHEGDAYINKHYSADEIKSFRGKLWVDNPYVKTHKGIYYTTPQYGTAFSNLITVNKHPASRYKGNMTAIYIEELEGEVSFQVENGEKMNAFYKKVDEDCYFMMGDNRDNSADSRFWGLVKEEYIWGVPKQVYLNLKQLNRFGVRVE